MESNSSVKKRPSQARLEEIVSADKARRAEGKPGWYYLAQSALPAVSREAQRLIEDQYRRDADGETKTSRVDKWAEVDRQIRETMPSELRALDALQAHVDTWTVCDKATIAKLFEGAATEQKRLDILFGTHVKIPSARAEETHDARAPDAEATGSESDASVTFELEYTEGKNARKRHRQKENRRKRALEAAQPETSLAADADAEGEDRGSDTGKLMESH